VDEYVPRRPGVAQPLDVGAHGYLR
jgi:hypothetical protein